MVELVATERTKKFNVILADPPWSFKTWSPKGNGRGAVQHYPTMHLDEICALQVQSLAGENSALFLWAVGPSLPDAILVMKAWGFTYKTIGFSWFKSNKNGEGFKIGMGFYTRANVELCLLGVRGKMPVMARDVRQVIYAPPREHSRKPDEVYERIEQLYPGMSYLELFARQRWQGWSAWGNEVDSDIDLASFSS